MAVASSGQNLTYSIVQDLGVAIVTGKYSDENPFPVEGELCRQFKVSRSVLREAVKMLTAKGLLRARPRQGTWVQPEANWNLLDPDVLRWMLERKFSHQLLLEFLQIRLAVEPEAAALAAVNATPEMRGEITAAIERMFAADRGEDDPLDSDICFHAAVLRASRNPFYAQLQELIETALRFSIRQTNAYKGVAFASVVDHKRVADCIMAHDSTGASAAMRVLVQEAIDLVIEAQSPKKARRRVETA